MIVVAFGGISVLGDAGQRPGYLVSKAIRRLRMPPPIIEGKDREGWSLAGAILLAAGFAQWL